MKGFQSQLVYGYKVTNSLKDWETALEKEEDQEAFINWVSDAQVEKMCLGCTGMREDDEWFWGVKVSHTHYDTIIPYENLKVLKEDKELNKNLKHYGLILFGIEDEPQFHLMLINII